MDTPDTSICLSHYFVNKQNVRSFGNIIKSNVFKDKAMDILKFYQLSSEDYEVSKESDNFIIILTNLLMNLKDKSKNDFKDYFINNGDIYLQPLDKEYIFTNCWSALNEIIPINFFGSTQNSKIMKNFVRNVIYSMKKQHFKLVKIIGHWNISIEPWNNIPNANKILHHLIIWILKYILSPIISLNFYVTACKLDADENKLFYFWKNHWQRFYDKQISKLVYTKVLKKFEPYSLSKKSRKTYSLASRVKLKKIKRNIPKLHLTLKPNNDYRPIVCYRNNPNSAEKYKIKDRLKFLRSLSASAATKMEKQYSTLYTNWINANKPKLYFVKTDLSNAFGSINRNKLEKILSERYMNLLKSETCIYKKKRIVQQYKEIVSELRKPILIRAGSTVYEWKEGLVQGYKYSPSLSELYYSHLDEIYFQDLCLDNSGESIKLFIRVVDDYLYITQSHNDAVAFLNALSNYRNVNYDKTVVNFPHENVKLSEEIIFLGYSYNTNTLEVGRASNIYAGQMCYKISFTSGLSDMTKFIGSRIGPSGIQITSHIFNLMYNNEELIWRHIFSTFSLSANRFCTILAVLCEENDMNKFILLYKRKVTVQMTNCMIEMLFRTKPPDKMFVYCINHFRYLSWKALYLCAKLTPKCSGLVPLIHVEIAKSNCIFGTWKDHARRIDANGDGQRKAIKDICRRNDLRVIFREFETLPSGFECYHHKRLK